ncbi:MAG: hypothetical protein HQK75_19350 [Candidatus Magnetomorum sp.]|nr:hypothetical protein [Candidatus Magnetomorum sp.]
MTTTDTIVQEETIQETEAYTKAPEIDETTDIEALADIEEAFLESLKQEEDVDTTPAIQLSAEETLLPQIKGLEELKEGVYSVDLETTINDMYDVIQNMESQLKNVLNINAHLEKDLQLSKDRIESLKRSEAALKENIARLEKEMPTKRELTIELDHLTEERNDSQMTIRAMKKRIDMLNQEVNQYKNQMNTFDEEKKDYISDVNFLESTLDTTSKKITDYQNEIQLLKGKNLAGLSKIKALEQELKDSLDEKYTLLRKLKESRQTVSDIHSAWKGHTADKHRYAYNVSN